MKIQRNFLISMAVLAVIIPQFSCEKKEEHRHEQTERHETDAHHEHTAPHGGTLVVFGDEFAHIELVLDQTTGKLNWLRARPVKRKNRYDSRRKQLNSKYIEKIPSLNLRCNFQELRTF